ncbi:GPALPP motifs-containing protein 1 [Toxorhynchites rutilus septentrionalis]|uniref:GPALPP motifs-containing protein 1 n=1 Tax=Toxorhynchites rutilus septentrionalis TaxID=329112 RepID=UPI002478B972|nr:GPALPP motifs-containing protein 1 [Toxorhynchites rutilus septentrionalis]XP_055636141.1 GPALPP motifs-containing protein 1 [Toxorhynchites rutilus septentrionalis]XP_055636142.1 GPALPP motifs-containing protein 1 [Toxorhynchites rutilus septentrionalis]XP_055636143.1 GPALPP motifs-containing protein 1 [Toxorhynchites rutilus septentrionalis]
MSDSDTTDSDSGIRFKTTSTRFRLGCIEKYATTSEPSHSADSSNGHRQSRRSERDNHRRSDDHRTNRRSKRSSSRSKSRSRSRERRKQKEKDRRRHRSRSRSKSKRPQSKREPDSNSASTSQAPSATIDITDTSSVAKQSKVLDISVSSLSSQEDPIGKEETSEDIFGPALPPSLQQSEVSKPTNNNGPHEDEKTDSIGPALPPHLINKTQEDEDNLATDSINIVGPTLPAGWKPSEVTNDDGSESELSPFSEEEQNDDDDFIGPVLGASSSRSHVELEQRALELKIQRFDGEKYTKGATVSSREDWMLELPDIRKVGDMGLGARQFRTREKQPIGDRSVWTDTPSDRTTRKKSGHSSKDPQYDHEIEQERRRAADRDKQQEELVKRHKKKHKRDKSMLEIHQTKVKKEKTSSSSEPTRRPFDRNIDLHANRFDDAQKKAIYKKAQLLDTRFSSGASKYL